MDPVAATFTPTNEAVAQIPETQNFEDLSDEDFPLLYLVLRDHRGYKQLKGDRLVDCYYALPDIHTKSEGVRGESYFTKDELLRNVNRHKVHYNDVLREFYRLRKDKERGKQMREKALQKQREMHPSKYSVVPAMAVQRSQQYLIKRSPTGLQKKRKRKLSDKQSAQATPETEQQNSSSSAISTAPTEICAVESCGTLIHQESRFCYRHRGQGKIKRKTLCSVQDCNTPARAGSSFCHRHRTIKVIIDRDKDSSDKDLEENASTECYSVVEDPLNRRSTTAIVSTSAASIANMEQTMSMDFVELKDLKARLLEHKRELDLLQDWDVRSVVNATSLSQFLKTRFITACNEVKEAEIAKMKETITKLRTQINDTKSAMQEHLATFLVDC